MAIRITITTASAALAAVLAVGAAAPGAVAQERSRARLDRLISHCRVYAEAAVRQNRANRRRRCGFTGARWSFNEVRHFRWCVSASPAARRRELDRRAAALDRCRRRGRACTTEYRPVCGVRDGRRRTYSNACVARREGARIVARGRCRREPGPPGDRACRLDRAELTVSSPNCSPKTVRIRFRRRVLRDGEAVTRSVDSGAIGRGQSPWGLCNFHSRIRYVCRNGRLRIRRVFVCQQARTNRTSATCRVSN